MFGRSCAAAACPLLLISRGLATPNLTTTATTYQVNNGALQFTLNKSVGKVTSIIYDSQEMVGTKQFYYDIQGGPSIYLGGGETYTATLGAGYVDISAFHPATARIIPSPPGSHFGGPSMVMSGNMDQTYGPIFSYFNKGANIGAIRGNANQHVDPNATGTYNLNTFYDSLNLAYNKTQRSARRCDRQRPNRRWAVDERRDGHPLDVRSGRLCE